MLVIKHVAACLLALWPAIAVAQIGDLRPAARAELIDCPDELDAFVVGNVVFLYRLAQLPEKDLARRELSQLIPVDRAELHGRPGREVRELIDFMLKVPQDLHVRTVCAVNHGDAGFVWKVTWDLVPSHGGFSGTPLQYHAYVNPDGSVFAPERYLCDQIDFPDNEQETYFGGGIFSSLAIADISVQADETTVHGDQVLALAKSALDRFVKENFEAGKGPALRFHHQSVVDLPIDTDGNAAVVTAKVWAVHFIDANLAGEAIHRSDPFTIWVTADGIVSELSDGSWKPVSLRKKE